MADLQGIAEAVIRGDRETVANLTNAAVAEGIGAEAIINEGLIAGMGVVGAKFKASEFYVPEVLIAARAMHAGMDIIKPLLAESGVKPRGIVAIGTVKGDLHDIGKNLVAMMLRVAAMRCSISRWMSPPRSSSSPSRTRAPRSSACQRS